MEESDLKKTTLRLCKELAGPFPIPISEHAKNLAAFATTPPAQAEYGLDVTDRLTQLYLVAFALPPLPVVKPRQRHVIDSSRAIAEALWVLFSQTQTAERKYSHLADMVSALPLSFDEIEPQTGFVAEDDDPEPDDDLEIPRFDVSPLIPFIKEGYSVAPLLLQQWGSVAGHLSRLIAGRPLETPESETYPRLLNLEPKLTASQVESVSQFMYSMFTTLGDNENMLNGFSDFHKNVNSVRWNSTWFLFMQGWIDGFDGTVPDVANLLVEFATVSPAKEGFTKTTLWTVVAATAKCIYYESSNALRAESGYSRNPQIYFALLRFIASAFVQSVLSTTVTVPATAVLLLQNQQFFDQFRTFTIQWFRNCSPITGREDATQLVSMIKSLGSPLPPRESGKFVASVWKDLKRDLHLRIPIVIESGETVPEKKTTAYLEVLESVYLYLASVADELEFGWDEPDARLEFSEGVKEVWGGAMEDLLDF
ncbi:UNVERIFIED_CONTAM: hypothetical protein HDU68_000766 [Siphonaria sp. JEL0065]|nr:hypothetical protein HDU68_000766 [Siphonaria sp. JEL0065]